MGGTHRETLAGVRTMAKTTTTSKVHLTEQDARKDKPAKKEKWKVWTVPCPGKPARFVWADGIGHAIKQVAVADGYTARCLDGKPVTKEAVAGLLAAMSPQERDALLAQYLPNGTGTPATTTAPATTPTTPTTAPTTPPASPGRRKGQQQPAA
jgi:hypothetical protein